MILFSIFQIAIKYFFIVFYCYFLFFNAAFGMNEIHSSDSEKITCMSHPDIATSSNQIHPKIYTPSIETLLSEADLEDIDLQMQHVIEMDMIMNTPEMLGGAARAALATAVKDFYNPPVVDPDEYLLHDEIGRVIGEKWGKEKGDQMRNGIKNFLAATTKFENAQIYSNQQGRLGAKYFADYKNWKDYLILGIRSVGNWLQQAIFEATSLGMVKLRYFIYGCLTHGWTAFSIIQAILMTMVHAIIGLGTLQLSIQFWNIKLPSFEPIWLLGWSGIAVLTWIFYIIPEKFTDYTSGFIMRGFRTPKSAGTKLRWVCSFGRTLIWYTLKYITSRITMVPQYWLGTFCPTPENPTAIAGDLCRARDELWIHVEQDVWPKYCSHNRIIFGTESVWMNQTSKGHPIDAPILTLMKFSQFNGTMHQFILKSRFFGNILYVKDMYENSVGTFISNNTNNITRAYVYYNGTGNYQIIYQN